MSKFLAGCHYNEEDISRHSEKNIGYWPVQMNGNKFATSQILKKTGRSCEGADFSWLSSKVSRTLFTTKFGRNRCLFQCLVQERLSLKHQIFFKVGTYHPHMLNEELQQSDHSKLLWAHCWEPSYRKFGQPIPVPSIGGEADGHSEAHLWGC